MRRRRRRRRRTLPLRGSPSFFRQQQPMDGRCPCSRLSRCTIESPTKYYYLKLYSVLWKVLLRLQVLLHLHNLLLFLSASIAVMSSQSSQSSGAVSLCEAPNCSIQSFNANNSKSSTHNCEVTSVSNNTRNHYVISEKTSDESYVD